MRPVGYQFEYTNNCGPVSPPNNSPSVALTLSHFHQWPPPPRYNRSMLSASHVNLSELRIIDGAMATELEHLGCDLSHPLWSARILEESPATIEAVHRSYLQAGTDCILTASYQVSAEGYAEQGLSSQAAADALRRSVSLAESARDWYRRISDRRIWIGASLGPFGAMLHNGAEYHGN